MLKFEGDKYQLGDALLKNYYISIDMDNNKVLYSPVNRFPTSYFNGVYLIRFIGIFGLIVLVVALTSMIWQAYTDPLRKKRIRYGHEGIRLVPYRRNDDDYEWIISTTIKPYRLPCCWIWFSSLNLQLCFVVSSRQFFSCPEMDSRNSLSPWRIWLILFHSCPRLSFECDCWAILCCLDYFLSFFSISTTPTLWTSPPHWMQNDSPWWNHWKCSNNSGPLHLVHSFPNPSIVLPRLLLYISYFLQ